MERQTRETGENPTRSPVALIGQTGDTAPLDGYQGELAGNEESVDQQEKDDERQTGDGANGVGPLGSRFSITLTAGIPVTPSPYLGRWR